MPARTKSTLQKVGQAVKDATETVIQKADEYVVRPVGTALGLTSKPKKRTAAARKRRAAPIAAHRTTKASKHAPAQRRRRTAKSRTTSTRK